jgi:hypothetical protein
MKKLFIVLLTLLTPLCAWEKSTLVITSYNRLNFNRLEIEGKLKDALFELCENAGVEWEQADQWVDFMIHDTLHSLLYEKKSNIKVLKTKIHNVCIESPVIPDGCGEMWSQSITEAMIAFVESSHEDFQQENWLRRNNAKKMRVMVETVVDLPLIKRPPLPKRKPMHPSSLKSLFDDSGSETE